MLQRMEAEILFLDRDDVGPGSVALVEHGCEVEVLDWIDDYGPTIWIKARVTSELDEGRFLDWVSSIVEPVEAGLSNEPHGRGPSATTLKPEVQNDRRR